MNLGLKECHPGRSCEGTFQPWVGVGFQRNSRVEFGEAVAGEWEEHTTALEDSCSSNLSSAWSLVSRHSTLEAGTVSVSLWLRF